MTPHGGNGKLFQLVTCGSVRQALKELLVRAADLGLDEVVIQAVKQIQRQLTQDPFGFGEPLYRLPNLKMEVRLAIVPPLAVQYAVHQEKPLVYLKTVAPLAGSGLS
jgi:hypothetical protein